MLPPFFLAVPATQLSKDDESTSLRDQAFLVAHITQALSQASLYKVLIAQFYTEHEYFPSSIERSTRLVSVATRRPTPMRFRKSRSPITATL